jgi:hypothetical protein
MRNEHIIELLDSVPLRSLSETDLARILEHNDHCAACRQAFSAARLSSLVLRERATVTIEPSPFFNTRVMAAIREKRASDYSFARIWKSAQRLIYSMTAVVVLLGALSQWGGPDPDAGATANDSEWAVLVADSSANEDLSYDQVLSDIYSGGEREDSDGNRQ